ncbi:hypothetical protein K2173_020367 [Erythroxylum novogranatense]|uniref:NAC domain-containing protein n=1 Tax=Erythroxylum novogranatense TaxID=1862640 RepID=A0AAV8TG23_9ROSI|nr:hypothetical protein K2173_020367 [Erythroxylum novogranatense]
MGSETPFIPPRAVTPPSSPAPKPTAAALAPGFRFHPTDEELVSYYLKRKVSNKPVRFDAIAEIDIYKNEPWDLSDKSRLKTRDQEWYFFGALDKKYGNGARMNRATGKGYWKATGKDREVCRVSQVIAMKKTLVFHCGRAPGGQRTNWVMHEYRLVDEELDRLRATQNDSYVLCRVFHKNNIGPPCGNRYAPFIEEEWGDGQVAIVPSEDAMEELIVGHDASAGLNHVEQDSHSFNKDLHSGEESVRESNVRKTEKDEDCHPQCVLNTDASFPLLQYKRRKFGNDTGSNRSNASKHSIMTLQDLGSSSTATAAAAAAMIATTAATRTAISALLEFSLMESVEPKVPQTTPRPKIGPATLNSTMPPGCMKFIEDLQNQIHKISVEKESMRVEMLSAQAMISILQSHIDLLGKENSELKRTIQDSADRK